MGGGGYFLVKGYWRCAAGWGCIFTTGLAIMELNMGLINKVDMVCLSPVGYGV